jgi:putative ATP-dependent endonuclease of OLD family
MRVKKLSIENFRSIKELELILDDTTVLIGPNNSGKSAILQAVRIALSRRWGQRGTGFTENDIHISAPDTDPRTAPPVRIQVIFEESDADEWPEDMVANLDDIVTLTTEGLNRVSVVITYSWNADDEAFEPAWQFLDSAGNALPPKRRAINLSVFYDYVLFFWLGALRDAEDEFTARSRHWGGLLKSINVPSALEEEIKKTLDDLDAKLLVADPRFSQIAETIGRATEVAVGDTSGAAKLRMLPLNLRDLLARAGVVLRNEELLPWLPLGHHGQGLQSLAVIFLFQAAVSQVLSEVEEGAEPMFAIEEPEVHLHPQAARTLWQRISELPGQKLVTTHSPYFVQHVPLHNIRLVRFNDNATSVAGLQRRIVSDLPWTQDVENLISGKHLSQFEKDTQTGTVAATVWFEESVANDLAGCWKTSSDAQIVKEKVKAFRHDCRVLVSKEDERDLALLGRRMRGEIFFARRWVLAEGQSEYALLHALGVALGYDLDQHGVAVIDFQNNGNPGVYAGLADAFDIPWNMVTDGDAESEKFRAQILKRGFRQGDLDEHVSTLPAPNDLEDQLLADGHEKLLRDILADISGPSAQTCSINELKKRLKNKKTAYMTELAPMIAADLTLAVKMPKPFVQFIKQLKNGSL